MMEGLRPRHWARRLGLALLAVAFPLAADAADLHVVRQGDTVEALAAGLNLEGGASLIRALNQLPPDAQPEPGVILLLPESVGPHSEHQGVLLALSGTATLRVGGWAEQAILMGEEIPLHALVCTGVASYASVRLAVSHGKREHDDITLLPETCLSVDASHSRADRRNSVVSLTRGSVQIRAAADQSGQVTVRTEDGVTTGAGGGYRVTREAGATRTEALYHPVAVIGAATEVSVGAGQGSRVVAGRAPSPPIDLLPSGVPTRPDVGASLRVPDFAWQPVEHALGYRVEVASSDDFTELLVVEQVDINAWEPELLFLPYRVTGLWWRVASFDRTGFLGVPSEARAFVMPPGVGP